MKIGVAGCGRMGAGMLANLQSQWFDAHGFDIRPLPGVETDISTFCDGLQVLFTVVRDTAQTDGLLFDDQGVVTRAPARRTVVLLSPLPPASWCARPGRGAWRGACGGRALTPGLCPVPPLCRG